MLDAHFHGEAAPDLAVVDIKRADFGFARGDFDVAGAIVPEQDDILAEIGGIVFGEGSANAEAVHDLHRLRVFHFILACDRNSTPGEQRIAKDHRGHHILVFFRTGAHVVVGHRAKAVLRDEPVERDGGSCGANELFLRDVGLDVECLAEFGELGLDCRFIHLAANGREFLDLENLHVTAKAGELRGEVGVNVEHAIVIMTEEPETVLKHRVSHSCGLDPFVELGPNGIMLLQGAGDLMEIDARAFEGVGNFRNRAGGAPG